MMNQRKSWTQQEDQQLARLYSIHSLKLKSHLSNWNSISKLLNQQNIGPQRTGKQCRQRWCNQLNPLIKKDYQWSQNEEKTLYYYHQKYGNRWSLISKQLPGRTDNSIKNYFNSVLRKSLRLINLYIASNRKYKQFKFRNVKEYKPQLLSKILALSSSSLLESELLSQSFKFKESESQQQTQKEIIVENLAKQIKLKLLNIVILEKAHCQDLPEVNIYMPKIQYQDIIIKIHQLNSHCKKRKTKKSDSLNYTYNEEVSQQDENQGSTFNYQKKQAVNVSIQASNNGINKKVKFNFVRVGKPLQLMNQMDLIKTSSDYSHIQTTKFKSNNKMKQPLKNFTNYSNNSDVTDLLKKNHPLSSNCQQKKEIRNQMQVEQEKHFYQKNREEYIEEDSQQINSKSMGEKQKNKCMLEQDKQFFYCLSQQMNESIHNQEEIYQDYWLQAHYL